MNTVWKVFLSMSFSGGLLILALLLGKRFLKDRISRQWQYYIWLAVILRLLLPFGPEGNLLEGFYLNVERTFTQTAPPSATQPAWNPPEDISTSSVEIASGNENAGIPAEAVHPLQDIVSLLAGHVWLIWLVVASGLLIRKVTIYQGFLRYIKAGLTPVSDTAVLDRLSITAERAGVKKPVELCVNPMISSPLLIGFFRPCIVLPSADIPEADFRYIILHELIHCKRRDMFYKWLVQVAVCLHWFNPLVHLMCREIEKACEFSCDEVILAEIGRDNAQDYGKTLLDAMAAVGKYKESLGAVTLSENKQLLKERLGAIMGFRERSKTVKVFTAALTLGVFLGACFSGVYPTASATRRLESDSASAHGEDCASLAKRYYLEDNLPLFEIAFSRLDKSAQRSWLETLYSDENVAFFSAAVRRAGADAALIAELAERAYDDDEIALFSILADCMDETELDLWLDQAMEDVNWAFLSILFDRLDKSDELEAQKDKEWEAARAAEYQSAGVTADGKDYYYKGELVNVFLDIRANQSFYTLNINPEGAVNIKIIRDANDKITGVTYINEAELTELLDDMSVDDSRLFAQTYDYYRTYDETKEDIQNGYIVNTGASFSEAAMPTVTGGNGTSFYVNHENRIDISVTLKNLIDGTGRDDFTPDSFVSFQIYDPFGKPVYSFYKEGAEIEDAVDIDTALSVYPGKWRYKLKFAYTTDGKHPSDMKVSLKYRTVYEDDIEWLLDNKLNKVN